MFFSDYFSSLIKYGKDLNVYHFLSRKERYESILFLADIEFFAGIYDYAKSYQTPIYKIPKIIHQIWLGGKTPLKQKKWMKSWQNIKGIQYKLWTDDHLIDFPFINKELFDSCDNLGAKSDILRYEILYRFGGLYVDTDIECLSPEFFNEALDKYDFFAGTEPLNQALDFWIANSLIASAPGHFILQTIIKNLPKTYPKNSVSPTYITGPWFFTNEIKKTFITKQNFSIFGHFIIFPTTFFNPITANESWLIALENAAEDSKLTASLDLQQASWDSSFVNQECHFSTRTDDQSIFNVNSSSQTAISRSNNQKSLKFYKETVSVHYFNGKWDKELIRIKNKKIKSDVLPSFFASLQLESKDREIYKDLLTPRYIHLNQTKEISYKSAFKLLRKSYDQFKALRNQNNPLTNKIPKIIHQIDFEPIDRCMVSWMELKGFEYKLWSRKMLEETFSGLNELYNKKNYETIKLEIIYRFGGIFIDNHMFCLDECFFQSITNQCDFFAGMNPLSKIKESIISSSLFGSKPRNPLIKHSIDHYTSSIFTEEILSHLKIKDKDSLDIIFPPMYFYPVMEEMMDFELLLKNESVAISNFGPKVKKKIIF